MQTHGNINNNNAIIIVDPRIRYKENKTTSTLSNGMEKKSTAIGAIFLFVTTVTLLTKAKMAMAITTMVALQKDPSNDNPDTYTQAKMNVIDDDNPQPSSGTTFQRMMTRRHMILILKNLLVLWMPLKHHLLLHEFSSTTLPFLLMAPKE